MSKRNYGLSLIIAAFMLFCIVASPVSAANTTVSSGNTGIMNCGDTFEYYVSMGTVSSGFSGYNVYVSLSNPEVAEVVNVNYTSWAALNNVSSLPASENILLKASDLNNQVTSSSGSTTLAILSIHTLTPGNFTLTFSNDNFDDESGSDINVYFNPGIVTVEYPTPVISSINPSGAYNNGSVSVNITGSHFIDGAGVVLHRNNCTNITGYGLTVLSDSQISCNFNINGTTAGNWSVIITYPNGKSDTLEDGFEIFDTVLPIITIEGQSQVPTDLNSDGLYEDLNGNSDIDYADVNLFFDKLDWMRANEPVSAFDFVSNGELAIGDIISLFDMIS